MPLLTLSRGPQGPLFVSHSVHSIWPTTLQTIWLVTPPLNLQKVHPNPLLGLLRGLERLLESVSVFHRPVFIPAFLSPAQIVFCAQTPSICDHPEEGVHLTNHITSLQNRRNSQLTHGRRERGGSGIASCSTISRIAATASCTSRRNRAVIATSSAFRLTSE
jgi:hypothetical protein